MTLDCFKHKMWHYCREMEFQKIEIFSIQHLMIKIYQDLLLKNGLKFMINQKKTTTETKKLELKDQC